MEPGRSQPPDVGFDEAIDAARAGDQQAWERIYRALAPPVLSYLRGRGADDAGDLLGEVMLQVVRDLHRFSGGGRDLRSWALTIAHHRLLDDRRRRRRRPAEPLPPDELPEQGLAPDAAAAALERLGEIQVRELIARLAPEQQSVILLRVVGDLTVEEVGRVLGKRPGAVKALQRRALAHLRREAQTLGAVLGLVASASV